MALATRKPETLAWITLWSCFVVFCLIVVGAIMTFFWYKNTATDSQEAKLTSFTGTVLVRVEGQPYWVSASPEMALGSGHYIKTDEISQALVTLFDKSVIILFPKTELKFGRMSTSRFEPRRESIALFQERGRTRISVAPTNGLEKRFEVMVPQALVSLSDGGFSINVDEQGALVRVRDRGKAMVSVGDTSVPLTGGQRTEIISGRSPSPPLAARVELVANSNFAQGLSGWQTGNDLGFPEGQDVVGQLQAAIEDGQPAVRFWRYGSKGTHCETYIKQDINADVSDFSTLELSIEFKLVYQNLSGGGYQGSEYPVLVRIRYKTAEGDNLKVYGFYYQNEANNRTNNGIKVPQGIWEQFTAPDNLMSISPPPKKIQSIEVSASGWDYESFVSNISLVGE